MIQNIGNNNRNILGFDGYSCKSTSISVHYIDSLTQCSALLEWTWRDGNNKYGNTSLAAPGALAHRLQRRTACNT